MRLVHRLARLEQAAVVMPGKPCPDCGYVPPASARRGGPVKIEVGWHEPGEAKPPPCAVCGQSNLVWIEFDNAG
jgi:hypothetical protein